MLTADHERRTIVYRQAPSGLAYASCARREKFLQSADQRPFGGPGPQSLIPVPGFGALANSYRQAVRVRSGRKPFVADPAAILIFEFERSLDQSNLSESLVLQANPAAF